MPLLHFQAKCLPPELKCHHIQAEMGRKKHARGGAARGIPGRLRAEKERRDVEAKLKQLRAVAARVRGLSELSESDAKEATGTIFHEVRRLALAPRGFVTDAMRCELWLFLAGCAGFELLGVHTPTHYVARCGAPHRDDAQVEKDIDRSLWCVCRRVRRGTLAGEKTVGD